MLKVNNHYWIFTQNYGILKATYKEARPGIGFFQCDLVDGYLILNNGIHAFKDRGEEDEKPIAPELPYNKEEWALMGWMR